LSGLSESCHQALKLSSMSFPTCPGLEKWGQNSKDYHSTSLSWHCWPLVPICPVTAAGPQLWGSAGTAPQREEFLPVFRLLLGEQRTLPGCVPIFPIFTGVDVVSLELLERRLREDSSPSLLPPMAAATHSCESNKSWIAFL
jgi:hypothetical protein